MSQSDTRAQRQRKQDECRLSIQRNNAYFSYVFATLANADNERPITQNPTNLLVPTNHEESKSSPALLAPTQAPLSVTTTTGAIPTARSTSPLAAPAHALTESANEQEPNGTATQRAKQNTNKKRGSLALEKKYTRQLINNEAHANNNRFALLADTENSR